MEQLLAFARKTFELSASVGEGSLREHLELVQKRTGRKPPELKMPPFPFALHREWRWFMDLNAARQVQGMGTPAPMSYTELGNYFQLLGERPAKWQLRLLRQLDSEALKHFAKKKQQPPTKRSH